MRKKYVGSLIEFKLKKSKETIKGILIDYSNEWTLLFNNPVDFVIDGFILISNAKIEEFKNDKVSIENKVLVKKISKFKIPKLKVETTDSLLRELIKKDIALTIRSISNNSFLLGKIKSIEEKSIIFKPLSSTAKWEKQEKLLNEDIDIIEFDTDYINSLLLIVK